MNGRHLATASCLATCLAIGPATALGYGEPDASGVPSREERFLLALTNQVRQAPHDWPGWNTSLATGEPRRAVAGLPDLSTAARFHAADMAGNDFFSHDSFDGTSFQARVSRYFSGPAGENIYQGPEADAYGALTAWMNSDGHRRNILDPEWTWLGPGYARAGSKHYYVQDFGASRSAAIPRIPAASSRVVPIDQLELIANYYDARSRAPKKVQAAVGATCLDLSHASGPGGNATYVRTTRAPEGCEPLVFFALDADGEWTRYPSKGAFLTGKGACAEYAADRDAEACEEGAGETRPAIDADEGGCTCVAGGRARAGWGLLLVLLAGLSFRRSRYI